MRQPWRWFGVAIVASLWASVPAHAAPGVHSIIVELRTPQAMALEARLSDDEVAVQRAAIAAAQDRLASALEPFGVEDFQRLSTVPFVALTADDVALEFLKSSDMVASISENALNRPFLDFTATLIGADRVWPVAGGGGQAIAILDSGVDGQHPFLANKVVQEACYSTTSARRGLASVCPPALRPTDPGSGVPCTGASGCGHGTSMAGIAAGRGGQIGGTRIDGVARDASIIAVQVASRADQPAICGDRPAPCLWIEDDDVARGLERVSELARQGQLRIAAVNVSLGDGHYRTTAECDAAKPLLRQAVAQLVAQDVAVVAASGNEGFTDSIASPACLSGVISVGSVATMEEPGPPALEHVDAVSSFSNTATMLTLLAPGEPVRSAAPRGTGALPGGNYTVTGGTSAATPHVAGAFAVLRSISPNSTVGDMLDALRRTGRPVLDQRNGIGLSRPRVNLDAALAVLRPNILAVNNNFFNHATEIAQLPYQATQVTAGYQQTLFDPTLDCPHLARTFPARSVAWFKFRLEQAAMLRAQVTGSHALAYAVYTTRSNHRPRDRGEFLLIPTAPQVQSCQVYAPQGPNVPITGEFAGGRDYYLYVTEQGPTAAGPRTIAVDLAATPLPDPRPDLTVTIDPPPAPTVPVTPTLGNRVQYTITVLNRGGTSGTGSSTPVFMPGYTATNVQLTVRLPAGVRVRRRPSTQGSCREDVDRLECFPGTLGTGDIARIDLVLEPTALVQGAIEATVSSREPDREPADNVARLTFESVRAPLVFIPGITGSFLKEVGGDELWPDGLFADRHDRLTLDPADPHPPIVAPDVLRSYLGHEVYKPLLDFLRANRYREYDVAGDERRRTRAGCDLAQRGNKPDLFVFAYDWRQGNADTGDRLLFDYYRCIEQFFGEGVRVNVLAHSMGSLVARRFVLHHPNTVQRMVTIGAPWLGAPKAIHVLETGEFDVSSWIIAPEKLKKLIEFFPAAHELLTDVFYFSLGGRPFEEQWDFDGDGTVGGEYSFDDLVRMLDGRFRSAPGSTGRRFHEEPYQADWRNEPEHDDVVPVQNFVFLGVQPEDRTIGKMVAVQRARCAGQVCTTDDGFELQMVPGDGTVPELSARRIAGGNDLNSRHTRTVGFINGKNDPVSHLGLVGNPEVQRAVLDALDPGLRPQFVGRDGPRGAASAAYYVRMSGVREVVIRDPNGRTVSGTSDPSPGRAPEASRESRGGGALLAILPPDRQYTATWVGDGQPIVIEVVRGTPALATEATRYVDVVIPAGARARLRTSTTGQPALDVDSLGDGSYAMVVAPSFTAAAPAGVDVDPPALSVVVMPAGGQDVVITITARDLGSALGAMRYSLGGDVYQPYSGPFRVDSAQFPLVRAFAEDAAGNRSPVVTRRLR